MQKIGFILSLLLFSVMAGAQVVFKTIVKKEPVPVGESFIVQFILEDADPNYEFNAPDFKDFRLVDGPHVYIGSVEGPHGTTTLRNLVYTLEGLKAGKYHINGANAKVNGNLIKSDDVWIEIIPKPQAAEVARLNQLVNAEYFLKPGEDPYQKMRSNLFLKILVDKTSCFVGEPITATYKLYSRLVSKSAIVKNPGFYGFTVYDMMGLNNKKADVETINGKKFDVHTIRKVQLYPLRAGQFTIDQMEVSNKVEFSRNIVTHKTELGIIEGVVDEESKPGTAGTEEFENSMNTAPVLITVKPVPEKNKPTEFTGATGRFSINAILNKKELSNNQEGQLVIEITGKGNFTQLIAPVIKWPEGIEGFDPKITDTLDDTGSPLKGKRSFLYSFVSAKPGNYSIAPVDFSFFDTDSNRYKTVSTKAQEILIRDKGKTGDEAGVTKTGSTNRSNKIIFIWTIALVILTAIGGWLLWFRKKRKAQLAELAKAKSAEPVLPSVAELLRPASEFKGEDKLFYNTLRQCIWNFFSLYLGLTGSKMNARDLQYIMRQKQVDESSQQTIIDILQECETGIFTEAHIQTDRKTLLEKTERSLERMAR